MSDVQYTGRVTAPPTQRRKAEGGQKSRRLAFEPDVRQREACRLARACNDHGFERLRKRAIRRALDTGVPLRYLAEQLSVSHETVRRWKS